MTINWRGVGGIGEVRAPADVSDARSRAMILAQQKKRVITMRRGALSGLGIAADSAAADSLAVSSDRELAAFHDKSESTIYAASGMIEQSWGQLSQAAQAGLSDTEVQMHKAMLEKLSGDLSALLEESRKGNISAGEMADWNARAAVAVNASRDELKSIVSTNQGALASGGVRGLVWGLGVAAVVAAAGYFVWRKKSRARG